MTPLIEAKTNSWQVIKGNGSAALSLCEHEVQEPKDEEVLVRMHAASLNFRDILVYQEAHDDPNQPTTVILGSDGAGEIVAVGKSVKNWKAGDRVTSCFMPAWLDGPLSAAMQKTALGYQVDGVLTKLAVFPQQAVIAMPEHLSFAEAATLPCAALTAWNGLTRVAIKPGDTVLIQGSGGVSLFSLQFATIFGAQVIAISSDDEKLKRLQSMGASLTINYKSTPEWHKPVLDFTGGKGVDHIVEVAGAATFPQSLATIKYGGVVSVIGHVGGELASINLRSILSKNITVQGIYVGSASMFKAMNQAIALHRLKPVLDRTFPFEQLPEALSYMKTGAHFGKIAIAI
jgi:NADPH:quinone reductase-like Zn-dependent oxidoreductase